MDSVATIKSDSQNCGRPRISIIIPVHGGGEPFRRCLESIRRIRGSGLPHVEVVIVFDGGDDGVGDYAEQLGMVVLRTARRQGPASARNLGAQAAGGEVLFFIDADVVVETETVAEVARIFRENPGIDALIGSYDDEPGENNFLSQYKNLFHHYVHQYAHEDSCGFWGACGAVRREIFFEVGGFDDRYREPCIEDIELGYRLRQAGYRIMLNKDLQVKHLKKWTVLSLVWTDVFRRAIPWTGLILRSGRLEDDLNTDWSSRIKVALVAGLGVLLGLACRWPWMLAHAGLVALALLVLDARLLRFFHKKRGFVFALKAVPWIWFYYLYSGISFAVVLAWHLLPAPRDRKPGCLPPESFPDTSL